MTLFLRNILLFFAICRILPSLSRFVGLEDDLEGSGYDQGGSGFDSVDRSVEDGDHPKRLTTTTKTRGDRKAQKRVVSQDGGEPKFLKFPGDSDLNIDYMPGHVHDVGPAVFSMEKFKTLLKSKESIAGAIAGGVMGLILAMAVATVMIYKWKMRDVGYTLGKKT